MKIQDAKTLLTRDGYCYFNLADFNISYLNDLEKIKYKKDDVDYLENFKIIKFDYSDHEENNNNSNHKKIFLENFQLVKIETEKLLSKYKYEQIAQIWYFSESNLFEQFSYILYDIIKYFYEENVDYLNISTQWTCYSENCFLKEHNDGQSVGGSNNLCAILIYLNDEWEMDWGGSLVIKNNEKITNNKVDCEILPKFGTIAIIDLKTFDTVHAVKKIIGNHNRCTFLAFVSYKVD